MSDEQRPTTDGPEEKSPDAKTLRRVLSAFGITRPASVKRLSAGAGPAAKFVIETAADDGHIEKFFLKQRRRSDDAISGILLRHRVLAYLAEAGLPVVKPALTVDGGTLLLGSRSLYELSRYREVDPWPGTSSAAGAAGSALADLHSTLSRLDVQDVELFQPATGLIAGIGQRANTFAEISRRNDGASDESTDRSLEFLLQAVSESTDRVASAGFHAACTQVLHGDFHPGNTGWHGDDFVAALDFDACRIGYPIEEAALASVHFGLDRKATTMVGRAVWPKIDLIEAFWRGYASRATGIAPNEVSAFAIPWIAAGSLALETLRGANGAAFDTETVAFASGVIGWLTEHAEGLGTIIARSFAASSTEN